MLEYKRKIDSQNSYAALIQYDFIYFVNLKSQEYVKFVDKKSFCSIDLLK